MFDFDVEKAHQYVQDSIDQCDSEHTYQRIIGIIDFCTYMRLMSSDLNYAYRSQLDKKYKRSK